MIRIEDIVEKVAANHPQADLDLLRRAYLFSAKEHKGQKRASGESYLVHPLEVANILADMKLDEVSVATGLLARRCRRHARGSRYDSAVLRRRDHSPRRRSHEDCANQQHLSRRAAGGERSQDAAGDGRRRSRRAREARRSLAQHAHASVPESGKAKTHCRRDDGDLRAHRAPSGNG